MHVFIKIKTSDTISNAHTNTTVEQPSYGSTCV